MRTVLIGGVTSTELALRKCVEHHVDLVHVFGHEPKDTTNRSAHVRLRSIAEELGAPFTGFGLVRTIEEQVADLAPDLILVIGLSQLIPDSFIERAEAGCVGFHPTELPAGRGRAPLAWIVEGRVPGAATLFQIRPGDGADAGPIIQQEPFEVIPHEDDTASVAESLLAAFGRVLDRWLPTVAAGKPLETIEQDHSRASFLGARRPEDGCVDWTQSASNVDMQIRAASAPHPGAFAYLANQSPAIRIEVLGSRLHQGNEWHGVVGRVLDVGDEWTTIQCADKPIDVRLDADLRVGAQLLTGSPDQIQYMFNRIEELAATVAELQAKLTQATEQS